MVVGWGRLVRPLQGGGVSGEVGLSGFLRSRIRVGRMRGGVSYRGCVIIAKFCMESLHFLHTDVIGGSQLQLMHGGRWV